jgi:type IV pilus assembly protein PilE
MIVVVIIGVLAAIAIISYNEYAEEAKTSEAYTMLGDISSKQESYYAEYSQYCAVYATLEIANRNPSEAPCHETISGTCTAGGRAPWDSTHTGWQQLGISPTSDLYMGYSVTAGTSGDNTPVASAEAPVPAVDSSDDWWAARAYGDLDHDGCKDDTSKCSFYDALSGLTSTIVTNEGE